MTPAHEELDRFCYDAAVPFSYEGENLTLAVVTRTAEVVFSVFDTNPAVAANLVLGVQTIEDFLAQGAPADAPRACADAVRAHLLAARRPGTTTRVELTVDVEGPPERGLTSAHLRERDVPDERLAPGPSYAGLYGWAAPERRHVVLRRLVAPRQTTLDLTLRLSSPTSEPAEYAREHRASFEVAPHAGERIRRRLLLDTSGWPALQIR